MPFLDSAPKLACVFYLLGAHALSDYVLQPEGMAKLKSPRHHGPERTSRGPWWWSMGAHALVNGFFVGYVTHWWVLGLAETVVHFWTDTAKCLGHLTRNQDQAIHLLSKVVWAWVA